MEQQIKIIRELLECIATRPNLPNPERDADWKNCMKNSSYDAKKALSALAQLEQPVNSGSEDLQKLIKRLEGFKMLNAYGYFEKLGRDGFLGFEDADYKTLDNFRTIMAEYSILPEILRELKGLSQVKPSNNEIEEIAYQLFMRLGSMLNFYGMDLEKDHAIQNLTHSKAEEACQLYRNWCKG